MFGVMFGDIGHGLLLLLFTIYTFVSYELKNRNKKDKNC